MTKEVTVQYAARSSLSVKMTKRHCIATGDSSFVIRC